MTTAPESEDDIEAYMLYRDFGLSDADIDLLLELALISPMSLNAELSESLAATLEIVHPHHAGAFIVRGLRARAHGDYSTAAEMFVAGAQMRFKAEESAVLCLRMLRDLALEDCDLAAALTDTLSKTPLGQRYLQDSVKATASQAEPGPR